MLNTKAQELSSKFNIQIDGADMNKVTKNGFYTISNALNGEPFSYAFGLIVVGNNSGYCVQIACSFEGDSIKMRRCKSGTFYNWKSIPLS